MMTTTVLDGAGEGAAIIAEPAMAAAAAAMAAGPRHSASASH